MCSTAVLSCPLCCQPNFPSVDSLRISLVNVTNRPLACPICSDVLLGLDKLTIHLFSHTIDCAAAPVQYEQSNESVTAPQHQDDALVTNNQPESIKAEVITVAVPSNEYATVAMCSNETTVEPQCDLCGFSFRNQDLQCMHMKLVHEIDVDDRSYNNNNNGPKSPDDRTGLKSSRYQCHLCSKFFKMKGSLRVHLRVVHFFGMPGGVTNTTADCCSNIVTEKSETTVPMPNVAVQPSSTCATTNAVVLGGLESAESPSSIGGNVETKLWECDICAKSFTTKYFLKKHKRLHTGEMPYTCEICSKTFTFQQSYHKHLLYHNDDKPHMCNTCGRAFKELSTLHNHERIHSGEKPFKCETCEKCFRQRVSYLVHRRIHTGVMPYKCTACDKSFRYKVSQRTHKCLAQPPGTVIRQTGDLLQKLMQSTLLQMTPAQPPQSTVPQSAIGVVDSELSDRTIDELVNRNVDMLSSTVVENQQDHDTDSSPKYHDYSNQSLDDFVAEHCQKIGIRDSTPEYADNMSVEHIEIAIPSPSDKFQNMCLYSPPPDDAYQAALETIDETTFKQFLYGNGM